jgi:hypothetical protein
VKPKEIVERRNGEPFKFLKGDLKNLTL